MGLEGRNSDRPLRVGLTGGIASGKSTVAGMFAELGAIVIDTDAIAREVVEIGEPALDEIRATFGAGVIRDDGTLNRPALRELVFSDPAQRRRLEAIVHPRIRSETGPVFVNIKVRAEELPLVLPPKDGVTLKDRFRAALLGAEAGG